MDTQSPDMVAMPECVWIRLAQPEDLPDIYALMATFDMCGEFSAEGCIVAEIEGRLAGFARVETADGKPYLRPIVVARQDQGRGVGKALLVHILDQEPGLTVIARGSAVGFYSRAGFEIADWDEIHPPFRDECVVCPDLGICNPVPLVLRVLEI